MSHEEMNNHNAQSIAHISDTTCIHPRQEFFASLHKELVIVALFELRTRRSGVLECIGPNFSRSARGGTVLG